MPGLAEPWKPFLRKLLAEDLLRPSMLGKLVDAYHRVIREEAGRGGHVNLAVGEAIVRSLKTFIARIDERVGDEERRVIQAAVRYS